MKKIIIISSLISFIFIAIIGAFVAYIVETPFRILKDLFPDHTNEIKDIKKKSGIKSGDLGVISLPLDEKYMGLITSPFGRRTDPKTGEKGKMHNGIDFGCPSKSNVYALKDGKVILAGWQNSSDHNLGYGLYILLRHEDIDGKYFTSLYGHLNELNVKRGDKVKRGQLIAYSGNTGKSTGPHLHFEIRIDAEAVDPMPYLEEFEDTNEEENELSDEDLDDP